MPETLSAIQSFSNFSVTTLNLFDHRHDSGWLKLNPEVDLTGYDILVVHNSVAYNPNNVAALSELLATRIADFKGVKVLFKQDENFKFRDTARVIEKHRFDIVLTCLPHGELEKIYPRDIVGPDVQFEQMLTGYITPSLRSRWRPEMAHRERSIDIGYRGSIQPLDFGRLCYEKRQIGDEVLNKLSGTGLTLDISSRWEDRFGGEAWFDFLMRCKSTLGVESGASIFDLDGNLDNRVAKIISNIGPERDDHIYAEAFLKSIADLEYNVVYSQVSPRHFEAAACGTLQIMYPGEYSSIFHPNRHYLSLERDFSNFQEIVEQAMDPTIRGRIVACAHEEIVLNKKYWIETFVARVDELILARLEAKGVKRRPIFQSVTKNHQILMLAPHRSHLDPRLRWIMEGAPSELSINLLGLQLGGSDARPALTATPGFLGDAPLQTATSSWLTMMASMCGVDPGSNAALRELFELERAERLTDVELCERYGASTSSKRLSDFRWYLRYTLDVCFSLVMPALSLRGVRVIIAADLPTLPAALILKSIFGAKVVYDAHEYWAESDARSEPFEIKFWQAMEGRLVPYADQRQVVSPGLAELMSREFGCEFSSVPNCTPRGSVSAPARARVDGAPERNEIGVVRFLFQGLLTPGRGLEELLQAWRLVSPRAQLVLRGPEGEFKAKLVLQARELGIEGERVRFLPAVSEEDLIAAAMEFDVGVIPYPPSNTNNSHCCPNKMSQYMAAGLPLLANDTSYVRTVVSKSKCGLVVDFGREGALVAAVNTLVESHQTRQTMAKAAFIYFDTIFNWEMVSRAMYGNILSMVNELPTEALVVWPTTKTYALYQEGYGRHRDAPSGHEVQVSLHANNSGGSNPLAFPRSNIAFSKKSGIAFRIARVTWHYFPLTMQEKLRPILAQVRARLKRGR